MTDLPPFLDAACLSATAAVQARRALAPRGALAGRLGERHDVQALEQVEPLSDLEPAERERIVAFPVPALVGATFELVDLDEAGDRLQALLHERLPGFDWQVPPDWRGPLAKYLLLHTSLAAPPNEAVPEPMALEVYAQAVAVDGVPLDSAEGRAWYEGFLQRDAGVGMARAVGTVRFTVRTATYANVSYPGVGVPFYL